MEGHDCSTLPIISLKEDSVHSLVNVFHDLQLDQYL